MKKIIVTSLALSSLLLANGVDYSKTNQLTTKVNIGYVQTDGNTETTAYTLDAKAKKGFDAHMFTLTADGQYASQKVDGDDEETKNKYLVELQYDYEYTERLSFGYLAGYKYDKFSGYDYQAYTGPGVKYKVIKSDQQNLSLQGNILYARDKYDHGIDGTNSAINEYTSFRAEADYDYKILENLTFAQQLVYRTDLEDTDTYFVTSKSDLKSKISDKMTAGISYKVDYANEVEPGIDNTDTTLSFIVGMDF